MESRDCSSDVCSSDLVCSGFTASSEFMQGGVIGMSVGTSIVLNNFNQNITISYTGANNVVYSGWIVANLSAPVQYSGLASAVQS